MKKLFVMLLAFTLLSVNAFAIDVAQGTATVDGVLGSGEWTSEHLVASLYRSAVHTSDVLGLVYAKYDCENNVLYFYIKNSNSSWPIIVDDGEEVWIKLVNSKVISADDAGASGYPTFAWVNSDGTYADGWEAAYQPALPADSTLSPLKIHNNVYDGESQTAGNNDVSLTVTCTSGGALDVEFSGVEAKTASHNITIQWNAIEASNHAGYNVLRKSVNSNYVKVNENLIIPAFPGALVENTYEFVDELSESGEYTYKVEAISTTGESSYSEPIVVLFGISAVESQSVPTEFSLAQNYPNPFNPTTTIEFNIAASGWVKLSVYDLTGKLVNTLWNQMTTAGAYSISWNGVDMSGSKAAAGIYFYQLDTESFNIVKRMAMIK